MNAHASQDEMAMTMPHAVSHYAPFALDTDTTESHGLLGALRNAVQWLVAIPRRRALIDELNSLTDRELNDVGLNRSDLRQVFDPRFTSARANARTVPGQSSFC
jgi:uncharacterized protein YjiS (DUF1127 family)